MGNPDAMTTPKDGSGDGLQPLVAEIMQELLEQGDVVTPLDVLLRMEMVDQDQVDTWRRGGLPYLERAMTCGLARVSRVLRLVGEHALALGLKPAPVKYSRRGKGGKLPLRFSKRGDPESEAAYCTHFSRAERRA
jgi:hypothetical protein